MKFDENLTTKTTHELVSVYKFSLRLEKVLLMKNFSRNLDLEWKSVLRKFHFLEWKTNSTPGERPCLLGTGNNFHLHPMKIIQYHFQAL